MSTQQTRIRSEQKETEHRLAPRFEGSNICTWIGFKHVMYCIEEAVLEHYRYHGMAPRRLYEENGLCLEIVGSDVRILHALHMDDQVRVIVRPVPGLHDHALRVAAEIRVERDGREIRAVTARVDVLFRMDDSMITAMAPSPTPVEALKACTVNRIRRGKQKSVPVMNISTAREPSCPDTNAMEILRAQNGNAFVWKWHVPYFYCHFNDRMQHSGYLRLMEEVLDLFVAERGISIRTLLENKRWIPVVPHARLEILDEAMMEETIYTVFTVEEIFKETTYRSRMDCYVTRHGSLVHTATGSITHGYAVIENRRDWALVRFDEEVMRALQGGCQPPIAELAV